MNINYTLLYLRHLFFFFFIPLPPRLRVLITDDKGAEQQRAWAGVDVLPLSNLSFFCFHTWASRRAVRSVSCDGNRYGFRCFDWSSFNHNVPARNSLPGPGQLGNQVGFRGGDVFNHTPSFWRSFRYDGSCQSQREQQKPLETAAAHPILSLIT